jgi:laminin alpha 1/2
VHGKLCNECKIGFYNLIKENPEGCTQCFCHGVTDMCSSSKFAVTQVGLKTIVSLLKIRL